MNNSKKDLMNQTKYNDEEEGMYVGVPIIVTNGDKTTTTTAAVTTATATPLLKVKETEEEEPYFSWAFSLLSSIQILFFTMLTSLYGFASYHSNPFIGPPIDVIDEWGSKNPYRIMKNGEYWRVVTAVFLNVGVLDLGVSVLILYCLSCHLEKRWGNWKLFVVYLVSGIGGNIFGTLSTPSAISVGSGGCIFGILGAMHIEMILLLLNQYFKEACDDDDDDNDDGDDNNEEVDDKILQLTTNNNQVEMDYDEKSQDDADEFFFISGLIVLGFLGGIIFTTLMGIIFPNSQRMQKDWTVLYGGMTTGMVICILWHLRTSFIMVQGKDGGRRTRRSIQLLCGMVLLFIPIVLDCLISLHFF